MNKINKRKKNSIDTCTNCNLCKFRKRVVYPHENLQCDNVDILFIGESPTAMEEFFGLPFVGNLGRFLEYMVTKAYGRSEKTIKPRYAAMHTIFCRATDSRSGDNREPEKEEILACRKNVEKVIKRIAPKSIIFISKISEKYYKSYFKSYLCSTIQPLGFLISQGSENSEWFQRNVQLMTEHIRKLK